MTDTSNKTGWRGPKGANALHRWKKGQSGNPNGRPRKALTLLSDAFREVLAEVEPRKQQTYAELIARRMVRQAAKGGKLSHTMVAIVGEIADRTEGKPKQYTELEVKDHVDPEARAARLAELLASGDQPDSPVITASPEDRTRKPS